MAVKEATRRMTTTWSGAKAGVTSKGMGEARDEAREGLRCSGSWWRR